MHSQHIEKHCRDSRCRGRNKHLSWHQSSAPYCLIRHRRVRGPRRHGRKAEPLLSVPGRAEKRWLHYLILRGNTSAGEYARRQDLGSISLPESLIEVCDVPGLGQTGVFRSPIFSPRIRGPCWPTRASTVIQFLGLVSDQHMEASVLVHCRPCET